MELLLLCRDIILIHQIIIMSGHNFNLWNYYIAT